MSGLNLWKKNAQALMRSTPAGYKMHKAYIATLDYIHEADWSGACHATTSVITAILRAHDIPAEPYIGECLEGKIYFDHSWIEVDGEVFDVAVSNSLIKGVRYSPVYRGLDLTTMKPTSIVYGVISGKGYDSNAEMILNMSFAEYMQMFPGHPDGLFGLAESLSKAMGSRISTTKLKKHCVQVLWREKTRPKLQ